MNPEKTYKKLAITGGLILIIGLVYSILTTISDPTKKGIFDLVYQTIGLFTFTFAFQWKKKIIILIGLIFWVLGTNFELLNNQFLSSINKVDLSIMINKTGTLIQGIGLILWLLGNWHKIENKYLTRKSELGLTSTLMFVFISTILFQILVRII